MNPASTVDFDDLGSFMRIKFIRTPVLAAVDGMDLRRFVAGRCYDVGHQLGAVMLAEGWAEPFPDDSPAEIIPFSESDPFLSRVLDRSAPNNDNARDTYPPDADDVMAIASDRYRRRRKRPRRP